MQLLDIYIPQQESSNDMFLSILQHVKPEWRKEEIKYKDLSSNGYINVNVACYIGEHPDASSVVIRIFEPEMLLHFRKDIETAFSLLNKAGLSPEILAWFKNGVCMRFQPGLSFTWDTAKLMHQQPYTDAVCREMARYHTRQLLAWAREAGVPDERFLGLDPGWGRQRWRIVTQDKTVPESFLSIFPTQAALYREIEEIESVLRRLNSPKRFCHMDMNPTNIIYDPDIDRAIIVDYENPCIFFVVAEIAWFFLTFGNFPLIDVRNDYPNEYFRCYFLKRYLRCVRREEGQEGVEGEEEERELDVLMKHVDIGLLLILLRTVIIAYVLASYTPHHAPICKLEKLASEMWTQYQENKDRLLRAVDDVQRWKYNFSTLS